MANKFNLSTARCVLCCTFDLSAIRRHAHVGGHLIYVPNWDQDIPIVLIHFDCRHWRCVWLRARARHNLHVHLWSHTADSERTALRPDTTPLVGSSTYGVGCTPSNQPAQTESRTRRNYELVNYYKMFNCSLTLSGAC